jgi:aromatic ring-opening dioxygenase catalytic subunit (LigB family)
MPSTSPDPAAADLLPSLYIPHGGGPCFFMEWTRGPADMWARMGAWLRTLSGTLPRPEAVVVISGHWEEEAFTATAAAKPSLIYDYYGFPEHTYRLAYPAPGAPHLAQRIAALLAAEGLPARTDAHRGLDHGVFIPFKLIYPEADIPAVQLSLHSGLDPDLHLRAGKALAPLRREGVLIVGSGMSYHNMQGFGPRFKAASDRFDAWLNETLCHSEGAERAARLMAWEAAPAARIAHPREEHLLPLMVAAGAADDEPGARDFGDCVLGVTVSAYRFGAPAQA